MTPRRQVEFGNSIYEECGTYKGFQKHGRYNTTACKPCTDARNEYMRDWRKRTGRTQGHWVYVPYEFELTDDHYSI